MLKWLLFLWLPTLLLGISEETLEESRKIAEYALHYQPIMDTISEQNKLLEFQRRPRGGKSQRGPVFYTSLDATDIGKARENDILFYENLHSDNLGTNGSEKNVTSENTEEVARKSVELIPARFYPLLFWS